MRLRSMFMILPAFDLFTFHTGAGARPTKWQTNLMKPASWKILGHNVFLRSFVSHPPQEYYEPRRMHAVDEPGDSHPHQMVIIQFSSEPSNCATTRKPAGACQLKIGVDTSGHTIVASG